MSARPKPVLMIVALKRRQFAIVAAWGSALYVYTRRGLVFRLRRPEERLRALDARVFDSYHGARCVIARLKREKSRVRFL
jgi:hypothetical protein